MKSAYFKLKLTFFFVFFLFLLFSLIKLPSIKAYYDCCPTEPYPCTDLAFCAANLLDCCYSACPYENWTNTDISRCRTALGSPNNYCCRQSSCSGTECGRINYWDWCHASSCEVKAEEEVAGGCEYRYRYTYTSCGAVDSCTAAHAYLNAGKCDDSGCTVGGIYKTCCTDANGDGVSDGTVNGNCRGGLFSGTCPGGSVAVQCGGGKPACGTAACAVAGVTPTSGDDDGDDDEEGCPYPNDAGSYTKPNCQNWWDCPEGYDCGPDGCCRIFTPGDDEEDEHSAAWLEAKVLRVSSGVTDTYEVPEDDCGGGIPPVNVSPGDQLGFNVKGWIRDMNSSGEPAGPTNQKPDAKVRGFFYFGGPNLAWDEEDTHGLLYHAPWVGRSEEFFRGDANAPIEILWHGSYSGVRMHDPGEDSSDFRARLRRLYSECEWQADPARYPDCVNRDLGECQECEEGFGAPPTDFCSGSGTGSKCETGETSENKGNQLTFCSLKYADGNDSYDSKDYFEIGWGDNAFLEIRGEGAGQTFCVEGKFAPEQAEAEDTGKICFLIGPSGLTPSPTPTPRPSPTPTPFRGPVCTF